MKTIVSLVLMVFADKVVLGADDVALARRRGVQVVEHKLYPKEGHIELGLLVGVIPNDAFMRYFPVGVRAGYHWRERWAAELQFSYLLAVDTELREFLQDNDADLESHARDQQQLRTDVTANFSPVYGKFALAGRVLHMDAYVLFGVGLLRTAVDPDRESLKATSLAPEGAGGLGIRVFLTRRWSLRAEFRQYMYPQPTPASGVDAGFGTPSELTLGLSALLGGP